MVVQLHEMSALFQLIIVDKREENSLESLIILHSKLFLPKIKINKLIDKKLKFSLKVFFKHMAIKLFLVMSTLTRLREKKRKVLTKN